MALTFGAATSDRVDFGSGASLDDLDPFTVLVWHKRTGTTNFRRLFTKGTGTPVVGKNLQFSPTTANFRWAIDRATLDCVINSTGTPSATDVWTLVAASYNSAGGIGQVGRIYTGTLTALAAEVSYDVANTDGSGALATDAAGTAILGNQSSANVAFQGEVGFIGIWNRALTLAEIQEQQFWPHVTSGCVLFNFPGFAGTGTQPDWSGTANAGTVTGATLTAGGLPLGAPWGAMGEWEGAFTAAAAAAAARRPLLPLLGVG